MPNLYITVRFEYDSSLAHSLKVWGANLTHFQTASAILQAKIGVAFRELGLSKHGQEDFYTKTSGFTVADDGHEVTVYFGIPDYAREDLGAVLVRLESAITETTGYNLELPPSVAVKEDKPLTDYLPVGLDKIPAIIGGIPKALDAVQNDLYRAALKIGFYGLVGLSVYAIAKGVAESK